MYYYIVSFYFFEEVETMRTEKEHTINAPQRRLLNNLNKIMIADESLQERLKIMIEDIEAGSTNVENIDDLMFAVFDSLDTVRSKIKCYLEILLVINDEKIVNNFIINNLEMNSLINKDIYNEVEKLSDYGQIILGIRDCIFNNLAEK